MEKIPLFLGVCVPFERVHICRRGYKDLLDIPKKQGRCRWGKRKGGRQCHDVFEAKEEGNMPMHLSPS